MKKRYGVTIVSCLLLVSACSTKDNYEITFKKNLVIDYKSETSTCEMIESIGDTKITKDNIKDNKIKINNFILECGSIKTNAMGTQEVKYTSNQARNRTRTKYIDVKDISVPKITLKQQKIEMTVEEYTSYEFFKLITVSDNWDEEVPKVNVIPDKKIIGPGTYSLVVTAVDKAGNKSEKKLMLVLKESPVVEEQLPKNEPSNSSIDNDSNSSGPTQNSTVPQNPTPIAPETPIPPTQSGTKDYLFSAGYNMQSASDACFNDLNAYGNGVCKPIQDTRGIYLGMRLTYY